MASSDIPADRLQRVSPDRADSPSVNLDDQDSQRSQRCSGSDKTKDTPTPELEDRRAESRNPKPISPSPVCVVVQHVTDGPLALQKKRHSASHGPGVTPRSGCWVQWFPSPSRTGITSILDGPRRLELPKPLAGCRYEGGFERGQQEAEGWHRVVEMEPRISALSAQHL